MLDPLFHPYHGGTEKVVLEISKRLVKNFDIEVFTSSLSNTLRHEVYQGVRIHRTPSVYFSNLPSFMPPPYTVSPFHALELLAKDSCVFHIHNRFWYGPGTLLAAKIKAPHLMLTLHNAMPEGISPMTDAGAKLFDYVYGHRLMEFCSRITAVSEYTKQVTVPEHLHWKCTVIHNGVDVKNFTPERDGSSVRKTLLGKSKGPLVLSNARLVTQKGFTYLISAFKSVKKDFPGAKLVIIGKGPLKNELLQQARKLRLGSDIQFVTGIPEEDLPTYYTAADLFVLPTLWEPCAVVLFEALASGKPVVSTLAGGNPEILSKDTGILVEPRDSEALSEAMLGLLHDSKKMRSMGVAARKLALKRFSWDSVAQKYRKVYEDLVC